MMNKTIDTKESLLLTSLENFYKSRNNRAEFLDVVLQRSKLSLRVLDALATNYSKKHAVIYSTGSREFNMYTNYKAQLKAYSKKAFDPFCRRDRITFRMFDDLTGEVIPVRTTVGQLNFFRWAIVNGVVAYARKYQKSIERDMTVAGTRRGKRKASESPAQQAASRPPKRRAHQPPPPAQIRVPGGGGGARDLRIVVSFV